MSDTLPRRSYELIAYLDAIISSPDVPQSANAAGEYDEAAVRLMCFRAGARSLVDELIGQMEEELRDELAPADDEADGVSDGSWGGLASVFGPDGDIRQFLASLRMAAKQPESVVDNGDKPG